MVSDDKGFNELLYVSRTPDKEWPADLVTTAFTQTWIGGVGTGFHTALEIAVDEF